MEPSSELVVQRGSVAIPTLQRNLLDGQGSFGEKSERREETRRDLQVMKAVTGQRTQKMGQVWCRQPTLKRDGAQREPVGELILQNSDGPPHMHMSAPMDSGFPARPHIAGTKPARVPLADPFEDKGDGHQLLRALA
jgi:hypothetical protein